MSVVVFIALLFSPLAGALAFVITYMEYAKHFVDKKRALGRAWRAALAAFLFFLIVPSLLIWLFLGL